MIARPVAGILDAGTTKTRRTGINDAGYNI